MTLRTFTRCQVFVLTAVFIMTVNVLIPTTCSSLQPTF